MLRKKVCNLFYGNDLNLAIFFIKSLMIRVLTRQLYLFETFAKLFYHLKSTDTSMEECIGYFQMCMLLIYASIIKITYYASIYVHFLIYILDTFRYTKDFFLHVGTRNN